MFQRASQALGVVLILTALGACSTGAIAPGPARTVSGDFATWTQGAATVQAVVTDDLGGIVGEIDASAELSEDGSFSLVLPETVDEGVLAEQSIASICEGTFDGTVEPSTWSEAVAEFAVEQNGVPIGFAVQASSEAIANFSGAEVGDFAVVRLYSDRAITVTGTCTSQFGTWTFDAEVEEGWNLVVFEATQVMNGFPVAVTVRDVAEVPTGAEWFFVSPHVQ